MPGRVSWEGMGPAKPGDTIGLLLELEGLEPTASFAPTKFLVGSVLIQTAEVSVTVYKNGVRLGVLWSRASTGLPAGVQGFSWAVSLGFSDDQFHRVSEHVGHEKV